MNRTTWVLAGILCISMFVAAMLWPADDPPSALDRRPGESSNGQTDSNAILAVPWQSAPSAHTGGSVKARIVPKSDVIRQGYRSRSKIMPLIQDALGSRDFEKLSYANIYFDRCFEKTLWSQRRFDELMTERPESSLLRQAGAGLNRMCDDQGIEAERFRLAKALKEGLGRLDADNSAAGKLSRLRELALQTRDGELLLEWVFNSEAARLSTPFDQVRSGSSRIERALLGGAMIAAACEEWGCDEPYRLAQLCGFFEVCGDGELVPMLRKAFIEHGRLLGVGSGDEPVASSEWQSAVTAIRGAIRALQ